MITIDTLADRLREAVRTVLRPAMQEAATEAALEMESHSKELARVRMRVRTGNLRRSISTLTKWQSNDILITHRAGGGDRDVVYGAMQEYGGVIRPKHGKYLAIPVGKALTPAGVPRYHSPRQVPNLVFRRSGGGNLVAGLERRSRGGRKTFDILFWLVRSVTIRPKRFLRDPFESVAAELPQRLASAVVTRMGEVFA